MLNISIGSVVLLVALSGCASNPLVTEATPETAPASAAAPKVKPDIDYSNETPDCLTAGQRIAENVVVGMTRQDVSRLVGNPAWKLPGSWWWSASFDKDGKPVVFFNGLASAQKQRVTSVSADTSAC